MIAPEEWPGRRSRNTSRTQPFIRLMSSYRDRAAIGGSKRPEWQAPIARLRRRDCEDQQRVGPARPDHRGNGGKGDERLMLTASRMSSIDIQDDDHVLLRLRKNAEIIADREQDGGDREGNGQGRWSYRFPFEFLYTGP